MQLRQAEWHEILKVLKETYKMWSPGLSRNRYHEYIWRQMIHVWARKNYRFFGFFDSGKLLSSCKLYRINFASRGRTYSVIGVGAVYTQLAHRGHRYAKTMLEQVTDLAKDENHDGLFLFSDIGADYYQDLGYQAIGNRQFNVILPQIEKPPKALEARTLTEDDLPRLERHYRRWLRRQPFGVDRSRHYWSYRLWREQFLHVYSSWRWPQLKVMELNDEKGAYAIVESTGHTFRVMEVVCQKSTEARLWREILRRAVSERAKRLKGWESVRPRIIKERFLKERKLSLPMVLPINKDLRFWTEVRPCPLLELDHV